MAGPILVTGAAGFAGGHLVDLLAGDGLDVVAWARPGGSSARDVPTVKWQAVDLLDANEVRRAMAELRPSVVYHCAGAPHVGESWESAVPTFAANVRCTHHLVAALRDERIDARVLIPSSGMVYAPADEPLTEDHPVCPGSPYALSKIAQELVACADPGIASIARPFNHFGPRQDPSFSSATFAKRIAEIEAGRSEPELKVGNLDARRDLTDVRDTVRAYRAIAERGVPGRVYNVCSGRAIAIRDLLDLMLARARVPIRVTVDPARYRPNDLPLVVGDPSRIQRELGWVAEIPIERTVEDLLGFWRDRFQPAR